MSYSVKKSLDKAINKIFESLVSKQRADGHWVFELEADSTIQSEYILLNHFLGRLGEEHQELHKRMAVYLRKTQEEHGGWPLFHRGDFNISASVKAYYALKCVGDDIHEPHMVRARKAIIEYGGAEKANVFTRIQMALFGAIPWRGVPVMPVEIMILPKWFPFHLHKIAYWSRTVIVPLLVLSALKPRAKNPKGVLVDELFVTHPDKVKNWHSNPNGSIYVPLFRIVDNILRFVEPYFPKSLRKKSINLAVEWVKQRLNGIDGLGAIYPAMANSVMMFHTLYGKDDQNYITALNSVDNLVVDRPEKSYCQPCLSPVWDTALAVHAIVESGVDDDVSKKACDWLVNRQILDVVGDWSFWRPNVRPGGWAFQYNNAYYPDLDDTAVVVMAMDRLDKDRYKKSIDRAVEWLIGLQSKNGGFAAFDADNTYYYLNHIPFSDHGALLDPPSSDVTARCLSMFGQLGYRQDHNAVESAISYLKKEQEEDGSWFGRWGTNYIYGTWSVLCALNAIGIDHDDPMIMRAVAWIKSVQQKDGGWGEGGETYYEGMPHGVGAPSTPSQTAWALLGLMAVGEVNSIEVENGIKYLIETQKSDGTWDEEYYNAVGFPRVFYLSYRGYKEFFPLWALSRYRNLKQKDSSKVLFGM